MNDEQYQNIGELRPQYQTYDKQKCFIAYSEQAYWSTDILSACEQVLSKPEFNLEPDYARKHFVSDVPLRQKALELIANARYGIYDLSCWRVDDKSPWQMPRNVFIELGIAIALNRPTLLLRHASNKEAGLELPKCLQCLGEQILEFSGKHSLKTVLLEKLPKWVNTSPEQAWWNRYCIFGGRVCEHRETHPHAKQLGQNTLSCSIADGADSSRPDFREIVEDVLERFSDVTYTYLDALFLEKGYSFLLCTHCQKVRSSPLAIHRITLKTPPEAFIAIGISIALETQFEYKINRILITEDLQNVPSLLRGYEVVIAKSDKEKKDRLREFMPTVIKKVRETTWKPKPLPFIDISVNITNEYEIGEKINSETNDSNIERIVYVENLYYTVTEEDIVRAWSEYGKVIKVYLQTDSKTAKALVEMAEIADATASIEALDGAEWMGRVLRGRVLRVRKAKPEEIIDIGTSKPTSNFGDDKTSSSNWGRNDGKDRIYELSKELNLDNKELLAICDQLNISVKSHSSTITESEADSIRMAAVKLFATNALPKKPTSPYNRSAPPHKQQILEIRKPKMKPTAPTRPVPRNQSETTPVSPMKPTAPTRPVPRNQSETTQQPAVTDANQKPQKPQLMPPPTRPQVETGATVYVSNLSHRLTEQDIKTFFANYGNVRRVTLPTENLTGRIRGFAFVQMAKESEANAVITELDGAEWMGRVLKVNKSKSR